MKAPHEILGTVPRPTLGELHAARRARLLEVHPDHHPEDPAGAAQRFREIEAAYEALHRQITGEPSPSILDRIFSAAADASVTVVDAAAQEAKSQLVQLAGKLGDEFGDFVRGLFR